MMAAPAGGALWFTSTESLCVADADVGCGCIGGEAYRDSVQSRPLKLNTRAGQISSVINMCTKGALEGCACSAHEEVHAAANTVENRRPHAAARPGRHER